MMAAAESSSNSFLIDEVYEFSAPQFYDFMCVETDNDVREAELWFEKARPYAPSPFIHKIKASRTVQSQILCDFGEDKQVPKSLDKEPAVSNIAEESESKSLTHAAPQAESEEIKTGITPQAELSTSTEMMENVAENKLNQNSEIAKELDASTCSQGNELLGVGKACSSSTCLRTGSVQVTEVRTPVPQKQTENKKLQTAKKIASMLKNPSAISSKNRLPNSQIRSTKPGVRRDPIVKNNIGAPNLLQENRAIKRQKLEGGNSRQIHTVHKPSNLPHKTKSGIIRNSSNFNSLDDKTRKEDWKLYVREPAALFVSVAEMTQKFQRSTREMAFSHYSSVSQGDAASIMQRKPKLVLTKPKTPEFVTSHRVRPVTVKSTAELDEEMMAKIPKFKARPLNKKILDAPTLPPLPRSIPQPPEFKEFHLETMSRGNQSTDTASVASSQSTDVKNHHWNPHHLTAPKPPCLQTSLRARPPKIKSSEELEKEELENIPQFKARPLNKKIFESKGEMGLLCNMKKQITIPQEFHFATDKRFPQPNAVVDLFDRLSISSEAQQEKPHHRITMPNPFQLSTEERGAEKEKRMAEELTQKQLEEERARVPKAQPYPYTTDYPVIPPKPHPKPCTKPEPFQLESLLRHEEELRREIEEKTRMEMEEAQKRIFKAQPILKEAPAPIPVSENPRKPLTEVQVFNLHADSRAADRAEFDKKIKEKELVYKRFREEEESARMMEEERALKQLRRTLVPRARPVPNFNQPFLPQRSGKEVTRAKSPKLHVNRRKEMRRTVSASHLR